ncbi:MAG: SUMF1/EgtB/PvdO family nonheme iron enzyme [Deltaproteobacteria bacterium]|nr:SUMF1/EgtB/PvdO family nonheme iron enzyme [Deltaproteobacteria bacterium]
MRGLMLVAVLDVLEGCVPGVSLDQLNGAMSDVGDEESDAASVDEGLAEVADEVEPEDVSVTDEAVPDTDADADAGADADTDADTDADVLCPTNSCPAGMAYVTCGPFVMGSDTGEGLADEMPEHVVHLSAFCIEQVEVTTARYRACATAGACTPPLGGWYGPDDHPVVGVNWEQARAYCGWLGNRLPSEAEWEKAARGGCEVVAPETCGPEDERSYPWGAAAPTCDHANYSSCVGGTDAGAARPAGDSPYGVHDLAGNVWEWVADWYAASYYSACRSGCEDPRGPSTGTNRVVRGGGWNAPTYSIRAALRFSLLPTDAYSDYGFRCARSP